MMGQPESERRSVPQLGGRPDARIQRYFCIDEEHCRAFDHVSKDAQVVSRTPKTVHLPEGETVSGWVVEISVPATDGTVRIDPLADTATFSG